MTLPENAAGEKCDVEFYTDSDFGDEMAKHPNRQTSLGLRAGHRK